MDVFISYKSEEFAIADDVRAKLEAQGIGCWMAPMSIAGGASYASEIPKAIRSCTVFLLILSEAAQRSQWVSRELDQAINHQKIIMPFKVDDSALQDEFRFYLANVQWYDASKDRERAFQKLCQDIRAILPVKEEPVEEPNAEKEVVLPKPATEPTAPAKPSKPVRAASSRPKPVRIKSPRRLKVLLIIGASVLATAALVLAIVLLSSVRIGGDRVNRGADTVALSSVALTQRDVDALAKMKNLDTLRLISCELSACDLSALNTSALEELVLVDCGVTDSMLAQIDLASADKMNILDIRNNIHITQLQPIVEIADTLLECHISGTTVSSIDIGVSWDHLHTFCADNAELSTLKGLESAVYLKKLSVAGNKLTSLEGLENTSLLSAVNISGNQIHDLSVLTRSKDTLHTLNMTDNGLDSIEVLRSCTALTNVNMDRNAITTLLPLENCSQLTSLSAADNEITSVSGLGKVTLNYLDLSGNPLVISAEDTLAFSLYANVNLTDTIDINTTWLKEQTLDLLLLQDVQHVSLDGLCEGDVNKIVLTYTSFDDISALGEASGLSRILLLDCPKSEQVAVENAIGYKLTLVQPSDVENLWQEEAVAQN